MATVPAPPGGPARPPGTDRARSDRPPSGRELLDEADVSRTLTRMAHQVLEKTAGARDTVLLGIPTRGAPLARRLAERMTEFEGHPVPVGSLDITLYRDDLRLRGVRPLGVTELPPSGVDDQIVVLVDDVLFSGRTVRAALDALAELGRPRAVQLAVLVDRGHRQLPVRADYVGKNIPTSLQESVHVLLSECDGRDAVLLERPEPGAGDGPSPVGNEARW